MKLLDYCCAFGVSNAFFDTPSELHVPFLAEQHIFLSAEQHCFLEASHCFLAPSAKTAGLIANAAIVRVRITFFIVLLSTFFGSSSYQTIAAENCSTRLWSSGDDGFDADVCVCDAFYASCACDACARGR